MSTAYPSRLSRYMFARLIIATLLLILLGMLFQAVKPASADAPIASSPASGELGTIFTLKESGFQPGERVNLWTTDPNSAALDAGYIIADSNGNVEVRVSTTDPQGLATAAGANYTTYIVDYDTDGNLVDQYLRLILLKPSLGSWYLTAQGASTNKIEMFNFNVVVPAVGTAIAANPASGGIGTVFSLKGSGFQPGEKVTLWTTNPSNASRDGSYLYADANGNILLQVRTSDPDGLAAAAGGNFSSLITDYDSSGNVLDQYLQITLYQPVSGTWYLTAKGSTSGASQIYTFTIS